MDAEKIKEIVQKGAELAKHLECDGSTRILNYLLTKEEIEHQVWLGEISYGGEIMPIHYWIRIGEWYIDNKSQMWLGSDVDQGMFKRSRALYDGDPVKMETSEMIFQILTSNTESYWIELNK
jgi:hypothetical protein